MDNIDILSIHNSILQTAQNSSEKVEMYKKNLLYLQSMSKSNAEFNEKKRNSIAELQKCIRDMDNNELYNYYLIESLPIINEYHKDISKKRVIDFMDNNDEPSTVSTELIQKYKKILKKYKFNIEPTTNESIKNDVQNNQYMICNNCQQDSFIQNVDHEYICSNCGNTYEMLNNTTTSYKDLARINISTKYSYDRKNHFQICLNQFQGKQTSLIPEELINDLMTYLDIHYNTIDSPIKSIKYKNITKHDIYTYLKEHKHSRYYDDVNLIYYKLTDSKPIDISHLESKLINDFEDLINLYDKMVRQNKIELHSRKNFINTQYVLYQLLKKYKYPCDITDFNILKTSDRKSFHDEICKQLFDELGWNFTAIL